MTRTERTYYVVTCLYRIAWASLGPTYALFLLSRGLDLLQINLVLATYLVTTCLFEIPTGAVADVFGRKASFVLSCVVRGIAFGMYYFSETFVAFLVAEFIDAIGTTLATGALDAWAVDGVRADGDKRPADRLFARGQIIGQSSMIASGLLITLGLAHDIERAWLVGAAGFFTCGIVGALMMREPPRSTPHTAGPTSVPAMMRDAIAAVREVPAMRRLCLMTLAIMFATVPAFHMWQPRLTELAGAGAAVAAWVWVALSLASLAGSALIPRLVPRYGRARTLTAAIAGRAVLLGIAGAAGGFPLAAVTFILQEMGFGFGEPVMQAWMNEHATAERRATMLSVRSMSFTLGGGAGLVVLGLLARATDIGVAWMVSAVLLALAAPGFLLVERQQWRRAPSPASARSADQNATADAPRRRRCSAPPGRHEVGRLPHSYGGRRTQEADSIDLISATRAALLKRRAARCTRAGQCVGRAGSPRHDIASAELECGLLVRKLSFLTRRRGFRMAILKMEEWYDLARTTNWTPRYVAREELFPRELSDVHDLPDSAFDAFDEPYKVTFRDYVRTQREKDVGAYSVRAALARGKFYETAAPGWQALLQLHFGAATFLEYASVSAFARATRFGKAAGMRNMATFGSLDEIRHAQVHLRFAHDYLKESRAFDWAHKSPSTDNWVIISERHTFDDIEHTRDATSFAVMTNFAFETCFTNLQFVALSADAARSGDHSFATMLQTIQSDEARHSQIGEPLLRIMIEHGKQAEAQKLLDISFWRCWKQFSPLSGICMDYYTPLAHREHSFKEFMQEWVSEQFIRRILDLGLSRPWYWDIFLEDLETFHHAQQVGVYLYRPTEWWHPIAGVAPDERDWLEAHYPGWNETFGTCWDVIIDNILNGRTDATVPEPLPMICNMSGFELTGVPGKPLKDYALDYKGRRYHFGSEVDRWIFEQDPERYAGHQSLVDRYVARVMPQTAEDVLTYMGMSAPERGTDGTNFTWVEPYRRARGKAA